MSASTAATPRIYLLTGPIRTGKTTRLMHWVQGRDDADGFLSPDVGERRWLYHVGARTYIPFEVGSDERGVCGVGAEARATAAPGDGVRRAAPRGAGKSGGPGPDVPLVRIGRFAFRAQAFAAARQTLLAALGQPPAWLVIDEVGRLELDGQGFEPALSQVVREYRQSGGVGRLLLVVRDQLLAPVVARYDLEDRCRVVTRPDALDAAGPRERHPEREGARERDCTGDHGCAPGSA